MRTPSAVKGTTSAPAGEESVRNHLSGGAMDTAVLVIAAVLSGHGIGYLAACRLVDGRLPHPHEVRRAR